jgi:hypothetical protein
VLVSTIEEKTAMPSTLRPHARIMIGLAATVGAFGFAATLSAATAPTARADDFTDVINNIDANLAAGQADFGIAATDFSSSDVSGGLAALIDGLDDDFVSPPEQLYIGTVEVLTNAPVYNEGEFVLGPEPDFAAGVTAAENAFTFGEGEFTAAEGYFTSGDYAGAAELDISGVNGEFLVPLESLLLGAAGSLGL